MINEKPIYITQPSVPPLEEFIESLRQIWDNKILTNGGAFHKQFEKELAEYLGVPYVSLFSNGTLALMTALQTLRITGEVITTPYTFVATPNALVWNGLTPVFVDVDSKTGNMDASKIEFSITEDTTAILAVHVYGNPCEASEIQKIADTYGLKVIYDAAHAFNVKRKDESILNNGDLSILSFHATKVFNTIEGGAIICHDEKTKIRVDYLKNFGFAGESKIIAPGINAKMNELQAAYGILQLKELSENIRKRRVISEHYCSNLNEIEGIRTMETDPDVEYNYSYYPIFINKKKYGNSRDELYQHLSTNNIYGRRYFYPLVSSFSMYRSLDSAAVENLQNAYKLANEVICLPIYPDLDIQDVKRIIKIVSSFAK